MSNARAVRYRGLAFAEEDNAKADLLHKLGDDCDRWLLCTADGFGSGHPSKMSSRQKQETPRTGLSGTHYMTDVENQFWQAVECRSVAAIAPLASWSVPASFLA